MLKYLRIKIKMNGSTTKNMYAHMQKEKYYKTLIIGGSRRRVYRCLLYFQLFCLDENEKVINMALLWKKNMSHGNLKVCNSLNFKFSDRERERER